VPYAPYSGTGLNGRRNSFSRRLRHISLPVIVLAACSNESIVGDASSDVPARDAARGSDSGSPDSAVDATAPIDAPMDTAMAPIDAPMDTAMAPIEIPTVDAGGRPIDVGLIILGHSTSAQGDWPSKLARALSAGGDPRNYVVFRAITNGDGGFLWAVESASPGEIPYARFTASAAMQYCEDDRGTRWSCRRTRLTRGLTGREPAPTECSAERTGCTPPRIATCVWHDESGMHTEPSMDFTECWRHMDVRIALVQDTTNRSWPIEDYDGDGDADDSDFWPAARIQAGASACPSSSGIVAGEVDFTCDGTIDAGDAPVRLYADWLRELGAALLDGYGDDGVDYVFFSHKPVELQGGACSSFPGERCAPHATRAPTPAAPFDHFYLPSVYWEHRSLDLLTSSAHDSRMLTVSADVLEMWNASARCYAEGTSDLTIAASAGRPATIAADDDEDDAMPMSATRVGCMVSDHVHHNDAGGWLMADVWYRGLLPYLAD
jgi:hypothetical protein